MRLPLPGPRDQTSLATLYDRATAGQRIHRETRLRPSLIQKLLHDPFWIWCEYHAPKNEAVDETSRYDLMRYGRGIEHERRWIQSRYPEAVAIRPDFGYDALRNTLRAMIDGAPAIHQPQLWDLANDVYGRADLIVRDDSRASDLGPYHYRVVEIKRALSLKQDYILQAAFYNRTLGFIQGYTPREITIALADTDRNVDVSQRDTELLRAVSKWQNLRSGRIEPEPRRPPDAASSPWRVYANKMIHSRRDLLLLAGVHARERAKLRAAGISRVDDLWSRTEEEVREILGEHHAATAYQVAQAYRTNRPVPKPGRALRIPRAARLLYFDFETSDNTHPTEPPHVYLIGCWDARRDVFVKFLARGAEDEGRIFEEFLDYVGEDVESVRLYHWTDYEIRQMKKVMQRWPRLEGPMDRLIRCCVDLKIRVQEAVFLPVPRFSIKSVAPALGFNWRLAGFGAFESLLCYWDYLETGNPGMAAKAITYNEDDCMAMWHVDQKLARLLAADQRGKTRDLSSMRFRR